MSFSEKGLNSELSHGYVDVFTQSETPGTHTHTRLKQFLHNCNF